MEPGVEAGGGPGEGLSLLRLPLPGKSPQLTRGTSGSPPARLSASCGAPGVKESECEVLERQAFEPSVEMKKNLSGGFELASLKDSRPEGSTDIVGGLQRVQILSETDGRSEEEDREPLCYNVITGLVTIEDVTVYFSEEESSQLDPDQKALHKEVMLENSRNVASLVALNRMKRRQNFPVRISKKPRLESVVSEMALDDIKQSQPQQAQPLQPLQFGENSLSVIEINNDTSKIENSLPECWTMQQYNNFKEKYDGLEISNKKLGCKHCAKHDFLKMKNIHVSKEWKHFQIEAAGRNREVKQASLRKKMKEHFSSKAHNICKENIKQGEEASTAKYKMNEKYIQIICRVFNTVYSLAQRCKPFSDTEDEIEMQIKNGLDMGIGLHSRKTAVKIVDFIAREIKKQLFTKIIENNLKICLIIDEASTVSCKPVVILFLKVEDSDTSPTIFLELIELEKQDAETIYSSVMQSLNNVGLTKNYLKKI
ncbi:E3 SUMO-protein ligase KIAA1586-like [Pantherophis guttatus]|uniref:E3 SUMO-protein ligase KIAA1586-like n=1 Tax=Pantherophis guttatus TaxID=94885 RepID=A0ABM3Z4U2_PANGU|nr:E3 SUMO-protein ligase KIAA1586-like [Pantherophis guttatus]